MSKTKEQIIRHRNPQLDNTIELYSQSLVVRDVITAMDEYASQVLSEYKEKLKAKVSDQKYMLIVTKETFLDLINEA